MRAQQDGLSITPRTQLTHAIMRDEQPSTSGHWGTQGPAGGARWPGLSLAPQGFGMSMSQQSQQPAGLLPVFSSPAQALTELQNHGAAALALYAKDHPQAQRLATAFESWEASLRSEAKQRLATFKGPPPLLEGAGTLLAEDWGLLQRVKTSRALGAMKRSASLSELHDERKHSRPPPADAVGSSSGTGGVGFPRLLQHPHRLGTVSDSAEQIAGPTDPHGSGDAHFQQQQHHASSAAQMAGSGLRPTLRVSATAPSLQALAPELSQNIEAFLHTSRLAIMNAQQSIQQTAVNCQQNLATLGTIFQQGINQNPSLQSAISGSRAMVTWSLANGTDPLASALVPWAVFPRYLRARELDASGEATSSESGELVLAGGRGSSNSRGGGDWVTPFEQYMSQLDQRHARRNKGSLRDPGRQVAIVTTAALPWLTGTAVNPLLRAAYLSSDATRRVTLVLPWLSKVDQQRVFPNSVTFDSPEDQEAYVREWAQHRTGLECNFKISWYPGRYAAEKGSILPVGDITQVIPDHEADVAVLEEPEHLSWYHHGRRWTDKFNHVVGVMHTNYLDYARREENGHVKEALLKYINAWVCRVHCHKVIKLSDAVQPLPRQETMFVHGVGPSFLRVGERKAQQVASGEPAWPKGVYFLGKVLWAKGYTELLDRLKEHTTITGEQVNVDVFGSGPDLKSVEEESGKRALRLKFHGARDHADRELQDYKVFINPSLSDVVATTTAEALAMGKFVVCADHPSNQFFKRFNNCLIYRSPEEFTHCLRRALSEQPKPLSTDELRALTWEAATDRFLDVADTRNKRTMPMEALLDNMLAAVHNTLTGMETVRIAAGAGSNTRNLPKRVTDYQPSDADVGGFFDDHARARRAQTVAAK